MGDTDVGLDFKDIAAIVRGALSFGRLRLHPKAIMFKYQKNGKIDQFTSTDISEAQWMRASRGYQLMILTKSNTIVKFVGLEEKNKDTIKRFIKDNYDAVFVEKEPFVKGWNWGKADFNGPLMTFHNDNKPIFEIPLTDVSASTVNKNEVTLEFHQDEENDLNLVEMRFYVPQSADDSNNPAEKFHKSVMKYADVIQATGDVIVKFQQVLLQTPRGRYDVDMYPTFLRLHGKSYDYKIPYPTIVRLFLLPHNDQRSVYFVITTDPPIRQGQTRYPHIVIQFSKDDWSDLTLELDEDTLATKYEGKLQKEMAGPTYETFSKVVKFVVGQKIFVPGNFISATGSQSVSCSHKANAGQLYPLERGFMYVVKPTVHIRFDEVATVNFSRVASGVGQSRSFDLEIETKTGTNYVFASIEKREYSKLFDFLKSKKIRIQNTKGGDDTFQDDFGDGSGSDNEMPDHYLEKMKAEGKARDSDDSDESEDADFVAGDTPDTSPSSSSDTGVDGDGKKKTKVPKETEIAVPRKRQKKDPSSKREPSGKGLSKKERKAARDPNKPKQPTTAYFLWLAENRSKVKEDNPGMAITDIAKKAGELWRELSSDDRQQYMDSAKELRKEYEQKIIEYNKEQAINPYQPPGSSPPKPTKTRKPTKPKPSATPKETTFKSKETVETDDELSDSTDQGDDAPLKKKPKPHTTDTNKRKRSSSGEKPAGSEPAAESSTDEDVVPPPPDSDSSTAKSPPPKRSMRGGPVQPVGELPDDMSDEAEHTDKEPSESESGESEAD